MNFLQELYDLCVDNGITIATAESCTSGLIASRITSISGSSRFFRGGVIAYQNDIKINLLGVSKDIIRRQTDVCLDVAEQMSEGVRDKLLADFSVATTGYAGPTGGNELNPIGTIFIAISSDSKTVSKRFIFEGDREHIVNHFVSQAICFLISEIKKNNKF